MTKETNEKHSCCGSNNYSSNAGNAGGGAVYAFGLFGALFYYLSTASGFTAIVMGILKSLAWPAMLVYHLFTYLKL